MRRIDTYSRGELNTLVRELTANHLCGQCSNKNNMCDGLVCLEDCYSGVVNYLTEEVKEKSITPTIYDCVDLLKAYIHSKTPIDTPLVLTSRYFKAIKKYITMYCNNIIIFKIILDEFDNSKYIFDAFNYSGEPQLYIRKIDSKGLLKILTAISKLEKGRTL
jgi:hypothetical protein